MFVYKVSNVKEYKKHTKAYKEYERRKYNDSNNWMARFHYKHYIIAHSSLREIQHNFQLSFTDVQRVKRKVSGKLNHKKMNSCLREFIAF